MATLLKAFFIFSLFLASVSYSLGYQDDPLHRFRQCQQRCLQQMPMGLQQQQCQQQCGEKLVKEQQGGRGIGELALNPLWGDSQQRFRQCTQMCDITSVGQRQCRQLCAQQLSRQDRQQICQDRCQWQEDGDSQQQQQPCQRRCEQQIQQGERIDVNPLSINEPAVNPFWGDPQQRFEQCTSICEFSLVGQRGCRQLCAQQLSRRDRQQICQDRCQGQEGGVSQQPQQQQPCQRRCEQQIQQGERIDVNPLSRDELAMNPFWGDPQQRFEQCTSICEFSPVGQRGCRQLCAQQLSRRDRQQICQDRCQLQEGGDSQKQQPQQQQPCQKRCEQQIQQGERVDVNPVSRGELAINPFWGDSKQRFQQCAQKCDLTPIGQCQCRQLCAQQLSQRDRQQICQERCKWQQGGDSQQQQQQPCQRRCEQQIQQGERIDVNPLSRDELAMNPFWGDPQQRFEQCTSICEFSPVGQRGCRQLCAQQLSRRDRQQICQVRCQLQEGGDSQQQQPQQQQLCQRRCEQQIQQGERVDVNPVSRGELAMNPFWGDPKQRFQQCTQKCDFTPVGQRQCRQLCARQLSQRDRQQICQERCQLQQGGDSQQQQYQPCERRCEQQLQQGERIDVNPFSRDPAQKLEQCQQRCESRQQGQQEKLQCRQQCAQQLSPQERQQICQDRCQMQQQGDSQEQRQCQTRCQAQLQQGQLGEGQFGINSQVNHRPLSSILEFVGF